MVKKSDKAEILETRSVRTKPGKPSDSYEAARRSALRLLRRGLHLGGVIHSSRDELHERKDSSR